jgi:predicted nuclease of predicted toxin-antitoxin system
MRFLLNMSVSPKLRGVLSARGHEAEHCVDVGLATAEDAQILERARVNGQVVLTADHDFPRLALTKGTPFGGIVLLRLDNPDAATSERRLAEALDELGRPVDLASTVVVVEPTRVRVHRLSAG